METGLRWNDSGFLGREGETAMTGTDGKVNVKGILIRRQDGSLRGPYEVVLGTWEETNAILRL